MSAFAVTSRESIAGGIVRVARPWITGNLEWLRGELGDRFRAGIVVHTGGDSFPLGDRIWAVPVHALCGV